MVFFERCVKSVSLIGDSVDRTAETQARETLTIQGLMDYNTDLLPGGIFGAEDE